VETPEVVLDEEANKLAQYHAAPGLPTQPKKGRAPYPGCTQLLAPKHLVCVATGMFSAESCVYFPACVLPIVRTSNMGLSL